MKLQRSGTFSIFNQVRGFQTCLLRSKPLEKRRQGPAAKGCSKPRTCHVPWQSNVSTRNSEILGLTLIFREKKCLYFLYIIFICGSKLITIRSHSVIIRNDYTLNLSIKNYDKVLIYPILLILPFNPLLCHHSEQLTSFMADSCNTPVLQFT